MRVLCDCTCVRLCVCACVSAPCVAVRWLPAWLVACWACRLVGSARQAGAPSGREKPSRSLHLAPSQHLAWSPSCLPPLHTCFSPAPCAVHAGQPPGSDRSDGHPLLRVPASARWAGWVDGWEGGLVSVLLCVVCLAGACAVLLSRVRTLCNLFYQKKVGVTHWGWDGWHRQSHSSL